MRILIGFDGAAPMDGVFPDLARAGLPARTEAVVMSVATAWGHAPTPPESPDQYASVFPLDKKYKHHLKQSLKDAQTLAQQGKRGLREHFHSWKVEAEGAIDDAAEALLRKAESWNADLIVVGSGRSAIGRLLLGSVSQKVLNYAQTSVRITREWPKGKAPQTRILVGVDGSPDSLAAVSAVCERSWPENTAVCLVAVVDSRSPLSLLPMLTSTRKKALTTAIRAIGGLEGKMEAAVDLLAAAGLDAEPRILKGDPRRVLLKQAKDWRAHCIFLGSRGLNRVERFFIGSVSSAVAVQAPCSVEIIKTRKRPKP